MGYGAVGAYGAAGGQDALTQLLAERMKQKLLAQQEQQRLIENQMAQRRLGQQQQQLDATVEGNTLERTRQGQMDQRQAGLDAERRGTQALEQMVPGARYDYGNPMVEAAKGSPLTSGMLQERQPRITMGQIAPGAGMQSMLPGETQTPTAHAGGFLRTPTASEYEADQDDQATADYRNAQTDQFNTSQSAAADRFTETQRHNRAIEAKGTGATGLTPTMEANVLNRLTKQWEAATKPARELDRQVRLMREGMKAAHAGNLAQGSQAVLVTFQKILDPTSVVRESEYMRSAAGQSLLNRAQGAYERLVQGGAGVTMDELQKFADLAEAGAKAQRGSYVDAQKARLGRTADHYKIPRDLVFEDDVVDEPADVAGPSQQRPIPGIPGGMAELQNGKWIRVK